MTKPVKYTGQFENVDVYQLGVDAKRSGKETDQYEANPVNGFVWEHVTSDVLEKLHAAFDKGWSDEHRLQVKTKKDKRLKKFKADMPNLGDTGYIEMDSNLGKYWACEAVYVDDASGSLLVKFTDAKRVGDHHLLGREMFKMGTWHKTLPLS